MKFVDVSKFNKVPADIRELLLNSNVLPVTIVALKNWEAINAKDENGNRKYRYILNAGSSRSSKTYSLIDCIDKYCREILPPDGMALGYELSDRKADCLFSIASDDSAGRSDLPPGYH
jgi:hypothetical protein